mmetsp:Transcript_17600/g.20803  ORF Transcript_17600/g.20803 Transcript_17600/m.20803 type:complete len:262 (+) Transcript_17600:55-840(+)
MAESSDLEQLVPKPPSERHSGWFVALGLVAVGTVALVLKRTGRTGHGKLSETVGLELEGTCFQMGMYYADPVKLDGTERTVETSAELCQQRCQVVPECYYFSFWPDGGCLLTPQTSAAKAAPFRFSATITGPKFCPDALEDAQKARADAGSASNVVSGAITYDPADKPSVAASEAPAPGVNGTSCSLYPACVDVGIKEGNCCPNDDKVSLGCCNGFPKAVEEVKIAAGSECEKFPMCVKMNITGGCCPTPDGIQLGCCSEI